MASPASNMPAYVTPTHNWLTEILFVLKMVLVSALTGLTAACVRRSTGIAECYFIQR